MNRLSSPIGAIKPRYDVVVIGSGYGGSIAASRLARAGKTVCLLERGKERQPGEYPATVLEGGAEMQMDLPGGHIGSRTGMFDFHVNHDISVLVGCGLGGTSLINANVSIRPDPRVFDDPRWPTGLRREGGRRIEEGFRLAEQMLGANPYPDDAPPLPKQITLKRSADAMGAPWRKLNINVTFESGHNHAGVYQAGCLQCGDCVSGCNGGSKNTVLMNYLPDAWRHGAEIFVETSVRFVEPRPGGGWVVHYQVVSTGFEPTEAPTLFVEADTVLIAAGTLGSTEILMRSRDLGKLPVSDRLGQSFSGNGDVLGFGYNTESEVRGIGLGTKTPDDGVPLGPQRAVGPCITSVIDMRSQSAPVGEGMIIEEGAIPGMIASLMPLIEKASAVLNGLNTAPDNRPEQLMREIDSAVRGPYHGATNNTQTYLGMCHDGENGAMQLEHDRLRIAWPGIGARPVIQALNERLTAATRPLSGIAVPDPIWSDQLGKSLITVHPLGGCIMGDSAEGGVVDHTCKVFSSNAGSAVHDGLYVCDGAVLPAALGVNPLLTISALAERCCMIMAEEQGFTIDYSAKGPMREIGAPRTVGARFQESMRGWLAVGADPDHERAARAGQSQGSSMEMTLAVAIADVEAFMQSPAPKARLVGTVRAPALSPHPFNVTDGALTFFARDPKDPSVRRIEYEMRLSGPACPLYHLSGVKIIRNDAPFWRLVPELGTLEVTLRSGHDASGAVFGTGVLTMGVDDILRELATIEATDASTVQERVSATVRFGRYFLGALYDALGGISAPPLFGSSVPRNLIDMEPPRKRRPLRVAAPELVPVTTEDGAELLLTHYRGGSKGPVILSHGMGSSSRIFSTDTIDTNLLEYLYAYGYDVWLFDNRTSNLMPEGKLSRTADDVALKDWPAAVAAVSVKTGAGSVQVVAHDLGAISFTMAMLAGLQGVRSAVCSQAALYVEKAEAPPLLSGLYAPGAPEALGAPSLKVAASADKEWIAALYARALDADKALIWPCQSEACHRVTFMYGLPYEHAQLDPETHASLYSLFGDSPADLFESIATIVKEGHVVDAAGADIYSPHLSRLSIPLLLLHGAENRRFAPAGTERTRIALCNANGEGTCQSEILAGYGHDDCMFGKNAARDVYPLILAHLEKTAATPVSGPAASAPSLRP